MLFKTTSLPFYLLPLLASCQTQSQGKQDGYLGFNTGATFDNNKAKVQKDFEAEFKTAQSLQGSPGLFNSFRLYTNIQSGSKSDPIEAFAAAVNTNTSLLLGIWCSGTTSIDNELKALKAGLDKHGDKLASLVVGISVGSEDMYRVSKSGIENKAGVGQDAATIVKFIQDTRNAVKGTKLEGRPIGHVDAWSAWANSSNKAVLGAVDFVGTDLYPYYEKDNGNKFDNFTNVFNYIYDQTIEAVVQGGSSGNGTNGGPSAKPIWITETGYPVSGPKFGDAETGTDKAAEYWQKIGCEKLFGRVNTWWYTLRDSNPANKEKFAITKDLSTKPLFDLTCKAGSGAPGPINTNGKSAAPALKSGVVGFVAVGLTVLAMLL